MLEKHIKSTDFRTMAFIQMYLINQTNNCKDLLSDGKRFGGHVSETVLSFLDGPAITLSSASRYRSVDYFIAASCHQGCFI